MTTNGKGSMGEPSLGIQTRKSLIYVPTTNCIPSNRSVEMVPNPVMSEMVLDRGGHFIPAGIVGLHT